MSDKIDLAVRYPGTGGFFIDGHLVSGIELLAQKVLIVLLTPQNGPCRLEEGTIFSEIMNNGPGGYDDVTLFNLMNISLSDVSAILKAEETADMSDDERLASLSLEKVQRMGDTITFDIAVVSVSGEVYYTEGVLR